MYPFAKLATDGTHAGRLTGTVKSYQHDYYYLVVYSRNPPSLKLSSHQIAGSTDCLKRFGIVLNYPLLFTIFLLPFTSSFQCSLMKRRGAR